VPIAEASLRAWLAGIGLNANDYNGSTVLPRIALATSGGGFRSLLTGAGVIQAFDGREQTTRTLFSGLLQGITYQTGTSGGAWLLTSFAANNYPTISSLLDSLWIQRFQYFPNSNPAQPDYNTIVVEQITGKKEAGFKVTTADVWSRYLAFDFLQSPNGGANVTFDQITSTDAFKSFSLPFPIVTAIQFDPGMCSPALNASIYEFTPYAFGSWDVGIRAFTPIKFLGTTYNNSQEPANGQCVIGYDNAGFVLGTSSFLLNEFECILLPNGSVVLNTNLTNTTFDNLIMEMNAIIQGIINPKEALTADDALFATYPNPFQGSVQSPKVSPLSELNFIDGGETNHNLPLWPLIQSVRKVDLIFANDNAADTTTNFPDGIQLLTTYMQAQLVGLPFPFIPNVNTFVSQGLNIRPTFFGCNETNVPLVIYLPNTNISFASGISTLQLVFSEAETLGLIQNGVNVATRSNSTQWAQCVACAIARRIGGLYGTSTSAVCRSCFDTYCFNPSYS
jgi:lysophospholipase